MSSKTLLTILAGAALGLSAAGCNSADNTNVTVNVNANANRAANANAVVTNTNANANATTNANSRNYNMTRDEYNKNANGYRDQAKNAGDTIGSNLEDGWIHLKVRGALATVDDLRDSTINVDVDNNVVTLRGSVANAASKAKAQEAAKVDGVKNVVNKLEVKADGSSNTNGNAGSSASNANKK